jgi:hypothetical protein
VLASISHNTHNKTNKKTVEDEHYHWTIPADSHPDWIKNKIKNNIDVRKRLEKQLMNNVNIYLF